MIEFPFEKAETESLGQILKPLIRVTITGPECSADALMMLDSGADISMIPYSLGEIIGLKLDMSTRSEVHGIGEGTVPRVLNQVTLRVGDIEFPARIGWALIEEVPFILGRLDVFSRFAIEFREFENKILLKQPEE